MEDEFGTFTEETIPARPARKVDFLIIGVEFLKDAAEAVGALADAFSQNLEMLNQVLCQHANYLVDREQVHEEMARELEAILEGEDG